jgi:Phage integrase family.
MKYVTTPYSVFEISRLFNAIRGHKLEVLIKLTTFYGLRRSEVLGLRWQAINFDNNTLIINHTFQQVAEDGILRNLAMDKVKRDSSYRTLPLSDSM